MSDTNQEDETLSSTTQVETENLIKYSIGFLIIIIIIVLLYYIISTIIEYNKRNDLIKTISPDRNAIFLNNSLYNQVQNSNDLSNEYLRKYTISNSLDGFKNYKSISNSLDRRTAFQGNDGNIYLNLYNT
tara:strand:+ start:728 stop:1117 length:390 start_codon:yes stop_codon:yes gene_type:complete